MKNKTEQPNLVFNENIGTHIDISPFINIVGQNEAYDNYQQIAEAIDEGIKFIATNFDNTDQEAGKNLKNALFDLYNIRDLFSNIKQLKK